MKKRDWQWQCRTCRIKLKGSYHDAHGESLEHLLKTGHPVSGKWVRNWDWLNSWGALILAITALVIAVWSLA